MGMSASYLLLRLFVSKQLMEYFRFHCIAPLECCLLNGVENDLEIMPEPKKPSNVQQVPSF